MIYIIIISAVVVVLLAAVYAAVFVPHILEAEAAGTNFRIKFWFITVSGGKKQKKKKKADKKSPAKDYVRVPTVEYLKRIATNIRHHRDDIRLLIKDFFALASLVRLDVSADYGTGDAAVTAICYGIAWQIITPLHEFVIKKYDAEGKINAALTPYYNEKKFEYRVFLQTKIKIFDWIKLYRRGKKLVKLIDTEGKNNG